MSLVSTWRQYVRCLTLLSVMLLAACDVELYTNLSEREANAMAAILLRNGIPASRQANKDGSVNLFVDDGRFADAVELLQANGYPEEKFSHLGEIFKDEGLVSSPTQERARFIYGLSQQLSETISKIDGVLSARLHVVIPENDPLRREIIPSSASVLIRHREDAPIEEIVPQIKLLVANGIEGLSYEKVSVTLLPVTVDVVQSSGESLESFAGMWVHRESLPRLRFLVWLMIGISVIAALVGGIFGWIFARNSDQDELKLTDSNVQPLVRS